MLEGNSGLRLNEQELEFAVACRDFVLERYPAIGLQIAIENAELKVPATETAREAFLEYGLARLLRVFHLAIENKAVPLERVPSLITELAVFNEKILTAFSATSTDGSLH